jgi:valyl-tRNA synthetase
MSKSTGNVIDPLAMTPSTGTDAMRFTMASSPPGPDIKLFDKAHRRATATSEQD